MQNSECQKLAYSIDEAVKIAPFCRSTIYNLINAGKLESLRVGGRRIIVAKSLHRLIGAE